MDELIEKVEELTELNTQLKANNAELEKQNQELLELEAEGQKLQAELEAAQRLNRKLQAELEAMQRDYESRIRALDSLSKAAAGIDPAAVERLSLSVEGANKAARGITDAASYVMQQASRYFLIFCFLSSCLIGGVGVSLYRVHELSEAFLRVDFASLSANIIKLLGLLKNS
ncbi:MAG: hypothetical protein E7199_07745 [Schwartzia succinivorans]|nr:hypothetical protein [Schwartzia succinivorans]